MKEFYQKQLKVAQQQLELATRGCISSAEQILNCNTEKVSKDPFTLNDVCLIADNLNAMLSAIEQLQKNVAELESALDDIDNKDGDGNA